VANIKSQIKRNRQNEKHRIANLGTRSEMKTRIKAAEKAAVDGADNAEAALTAAISRIDRAVNKGVLHKNTAARKKSRLVKRVAASSE
jgi:small subunit ribosomal protein S20